MFNQDKGKLALIVKDCRDGEPATGKHGICEGDIPIRFTFKKPGESYKTCEYSEENENLLIACGFVHMNTLTDMAAKDLGLTLPMHGDGPETQEAFKKHWNRLNELEEQYPFYFESTNPRILLEDGSRIWGCECWWKTVESKIPDDKLQEVLEAGEKSIEGFCQVFKALLEQMTETGTKINQEN